MRALLAIFLILATASPGAADTELVVLGPVGAAAEVAPVKAALGKAQVGNVSTKKISIACATDPGCLAKTGGELGARRVLAITVAAGAKVSIMLVDVGAKLLLGTRDLAIARRRLNKELGPTLAKLIADVPVEKAKGLFAEGNEHFNLGEFTQALDKYKLAYRVKPLPAFQFNIAQCHRKLGQHRDAIAMYQAFLVGVPDASNKAMVESLISESQKALAEESVAQQQRESERLVSEQKKAEEARKAKEAEAAASAEQSKTEQARIAAERERDRTYNRHPARKWMLMTGALGLATAGVGAYFGVQARDAQRAFDSAGCGDPSQLLGQAALASCVDDRERGQQRAFLSNVVIGSGGAVVLTSLLVLILDPGNLERPSSTRPTVAVTPSTLKVTFRW